MDPAPSGLQEVDGLNHLLGIRRLIDVLVCYVLRDHLVSGLPER